MYASFKAQTDMSIKTIIFLGSVREGRNGLRVARFFKGRLEAAGHTVEIFDPQVMNFPLVKKPLHFRADSEKEEWMVAANKKIQEADAFVTITAEYNRCIAPALTNMIDHFPIPSFAFRPTAIVSYSMGPFGGYGAAEQCRTLMGEMASVTMPQLLCIPVVHNALNEEGVPQNENFLPQTDKLVKQLTWYAKALKTQRDTHGIPK